MAAVFSAIAGTPVIAVNYLPKVEGFMKGVGMAYNLIQVNNIKAEFLINLIKVNIEKREQIANDVNDQISVKRNIVGQYADLALSVLR